MISEDDQTADDTVKDGAGGGGEDHDLTPAKLEEKDRADAGAETPEQGGDDGHQHGAAQAELSKQVNGEEDDAVDSSDGVESEYGEENEESFAVDSGEELLEGAPECVFRCLSAGSHLC